MWSDFTLIFHDSWINVKQKKEQHIKFVFVIFSMLFIHQGLLLFMGMLQSVRKRQYQCAISWNREGKQMVGTSQEKLIISIKKELIDCYSHKTCLFFSFFTFTRNLKQKFPIQEESRTHWLRKSLSIGSIMCLCTWGSFMKLPTMKSIRVQKTPQSGCKLAVN